MSFTRALTSINSFIPSITKAMHLITKNKNKTHASFLLFSSMILLLIGLGDHFSTWKQELRNSYWLKLALLNFIWKVLSFFHCFMFMLGYIILTSLVIITFAVIGETITLISPQELTFLSNGEW